MKSTHPNPAPKAYRAIIIHDGAVESLASVGITPTLKSVTIEDRQFDINGVYQDDDRAAHYENLVFPLVNRFKRGESTWVYTFGSNVSRFLGTGCTSEGILISILTHLVAQNVEFQLKIILSPQTARKGSGIVAQQSRDIQEIKNLIRGLSVGNNPQWDPKYDLLIELSYGKTKLVLVHLADKLAHKVHTYVLKTLQSFGKGHLGHIFIIGCVSDSDTSVKAADVVKKVANFYSDRLGTVIGSKAEKDGNSLEYIPSGKMESQSVSAVVPPSDHDPGEDDPNLVNQDLSMDTNIPLNDTTVAVHDTEDTIIEDFAMVVDDSLTGDPSGVEISTHQYLASIQHLRQDNIILTNDNDW